MWMLVRRNAMQAEPDGSTTLAACPDSADRGDAWQWSVRRVPEGPPTAGGRDGSTTGWRVVVEHDPDHVRADCTTLHDANLDLVRNPGEELVVVPLQGEHLIAHATGPWQRWLAPGDVFVVEGEDGEDLRLAAAPGAGRVAVVRLQPTRAHALRWVP